MDSTVFLHKPVTGGSWVWPPSLRSQKLRSEEEQRLPEPWEAAGLIPHRQIKSHMKVCERISWYVFKTHQLQFSLWLEVSQPLTSPRLICFPCIFFSPLSTSCGNRVCRAVFPPRRARRGHVWTSRQRWQSVKTQRWGQTMRCGDGGVPTRRGAELWRWQRLPARMSPWHMGRNNGGRAGRMSLSKLKWSHQGFFEWRWKCVTHLCIVALCH